MTIFTSTGEQIVGEFLKALADGKTRFGKEIAEAAGQKAHPWFGPAYSYIFLARLEDMGLITGIEESVPEGARRLPRRMYTITQKGLELINKSLPLS